MYRALKATKSSPLYLRRQLSSAASIPSAVTTFDTSLVCHCGAKSHGDAESPLFKCPDAQNATHIDHVLMPAPLSPSDLAELVERATIRPDIVNPFVKWRALLYPYRVAMSRHMRCAGVYVRGVLRIAIDTGPLT